MPDVSIKNVLAPVILASLSGCMFSDAGHVDILHNEAALKKVGEILELTGQARR